MNDVSLFAALCAIGNALEGVRDTTQGDLWRRLDDVLAALDAVIDRLGPPPVVEDESL